MSSNRWRRILISLLLFSSVPLTAKPLHHYVFFNLDRAGIRNPAFLRNRAFEGAQIKYAWRKLEPSKDRYDFSAIRDDLAFLTGHGKKLFIQVQDVSFSGSFDNVPEYLHHDPAYHGGVARDVVDEEKGIRGGWVARRWDPAVRERFHKLLGALGEEFDGRIEGINLPETSIDFGQTGQLHPAGYSPATYCESVLETMTALKRAFPHSVAMIYANFMPGEWLPDNDQGFLRGVYQHARAIGLAVGNPDLLPNRRWQIKHSYHLIRDAAGVVPTGIAVQEGNYAFTNPRTGKRVVVADMLAFACDYLKVDYIFWFPEEPYFSRDVVPFLKRAASSSDDDVNCQSAADAAGRSATSQRSRRSP